VTWRIGEILVRKKLISWDQLEKVLEEQRLTKKLTGEILVKNNYVPQYFVYQALAEQFNLQLIDLERTRINPKAIELIPKHVIHQFQILPIEIQTGTLIIGISNPLTTWPKSDIKKMTKVQEVQCVLCLPNQLEDAIEKFYGKLPQAAIASS